VHGALVDRFVVPVQGDGFVEDVGGGFRVVGGEFVGELEVGFGADAADGFAVGCDPFVAASLGQRSG
jgi:hypothetical protein